MRHLATVLGDFLIEMFTPRVDRSPWRGESATLLLSTVSMGECTLYSRFSPIFLCSQTKILEGGTKCEMRIFESEMYAPRTKMLEGRTNRSERVFEALFNDS